MNITRAQAAQLAARTQAPELRALEPGELLAIWVPCLLRGKNGPHGQLVRHASGKVWSERATSKKTLRDQVATAIFLQTAWAKMKRPAPRAPKIVNFIAYVAREWDDDGLAYALAGARDALITMGVIHDDAPAAGHVFNYAQHVDRKLSAPRGVEIRVRLAP